MNIPRVVVERIDHHATPCVRQRCRSRATYIVVNPHTGQRDNTCGHHLGGCVANNIARQHVAIATAEAS